MKLENNHHVKTSDMSGYQYRRIRDKINAQYGSSAPIMTNWRDWKYVGVRGEGIYYADSYFESHPEKLLTIDQALADDESDDLIDAVNEMRKVNNEIEKLFNRKAELEKIICDGLDIS